MIPAARMAEWCIRKPYKARLEYIESTGEQWIDTGIVADYTTTANVRFQFTEIFNDNAILSMDSGVSNNKSFIIEYYYKSTAPFGLCISLDGYAAAYQTQKTCTTGVWYDVFASVAKCTVNGTDMVKVITPSPFAGEYTLVMFAFGRNGVAARKGKSRVSFCILHKNGSLVRSFIPVLTWNDIACMYDEVTSEFFYNQGSGAFLAGPVIS